MGPVIADGQQHGQLVGCLVAGGLTEGPRRELAGECGVVEQPGLAIGLEGGDERVLHLYPGFLGREHGRQPVSGDDIEHGDRAPPGDTPEVGEVVDPDLPGYQFHPVGPRCSPSGFPHDRDPGKMHPSAVRTRNTVDSEA